MAASTPSSPPFSIALFDLDGTLADTEELITRSHLHALAQELPSFPATREATRPWLGEPLQATYERLAPADPALVARLIAAYRDFNEAQHDALIREVPGMRAAIARLASAGVQLAVVTSKRTATALRGLDACGLRAHFPVVVGVEQVAQHKPHPAPALEALRRLGAAPGTHVAFVGDAPSDVACGHAAGCGASIAVEWSALERARLEAERPTHWAEDAGALVRILLGGE